MAGSTRKLDQLKAKEAKQKKIAIAGFLLFVILMVVQAPKILHHGPPQSTAAPPPTATPAPGTDTSSLAPPSVAGSGDSSASASGSSSGSGASSALADTDVRPAPEDGQLVQFDLFSAKDPFVPQVTADTGSGASAPAKPKPDSKPEPSGDEKPAEQPAGGGIGTGGAADGPKAPPVPKTAVALLSVDGTTEQVVASGSFPAADPVFQLASFTAKEAQISVVGGQYQDGAPTLKLEKGHSVTLLNTENGTRYEVAYLGSKKVPTSSLPASAPAPTTTTSGTETTPAPTPPAPPATTAPTATTASAFTG